MVNNKKGLALVTTLFLSFIALALIAILMTLVFRSTKISGSFKRYTSALEAARGAFEVMFASDFLNPSSKDWATGHSCKLDPIESSIEWSTNSCSSICGGSKYIHCVSHSTPQDIMNYYDWKKDFGNYVVYAKITNVIHISTPNAASPENRNYWLYSVDFVAKSKLNQSGIAWLTVLFKE